MTLDKAPESFSELVGLLFGRVLVVALETSVKLAVLWWALSWWGIL